MKDYCISTHNCFGKPNLYKFSNATNAKFHYTKNNVYSRITVVSLIYLVY